MDYFIDQIEYKFKELDWNEVYDFIEFVFSELNDYEVQSLIVEISRIFLEEGVQYKVENKQIVQLMNKQEAEEISKANTNENYGVHINRAITLFNKRPDPDYENSITESLKAVESFLRDITGDDSGILSQLVKKLNLHPALQLGIEKIYAWTGDDSGLRHSIKNKRINNYEAEARFSLVFCSSLINYLKEVSAREGSN
jgi:hypothetical protein